MRKAAKVVWLNRDGLVFTTMAGLCMSDWNVRRDLYCRLAAAGLPKVKPHGLRFYYASVLHDQGMPLPVIAANLGHKDAGITLRIYSHMFTDQRGVAGAAMSRAFGVK